MANSIKRKKDKGRRTSAIVLLYISFLHFVFLLSLLFLNMYYIHSTINSFEYLLNFDFMAFVVVAFVGAIKHICTKNVFV